jgi:hypothetical protein
MSFLDKLMLGLLAWISVHILALVLYNRYRRTELLRCFQICRGQELPEQEFRSLLTTYTSFLGFALPAPSRTAYPRLYTNSTFSAFASRSKRILAYLIATIILSFVLASVIDSIQH